MLLLDDEKEFDLLGSLRKHFDSVGLFDNSKQNRSDFLFTRFLSSTLGTAGSFFELYFLSPMSNIAFSLEKSILLADSPLQTFKQNGYDVVFISSAYGSWQNIGEYFKYQGIEKFYDVNYLISKYPNAKESLNAYGARDEFIYKEILSTLSNTTNPTLIITLTTSNHPPFSIPKEFSIIPSPPIS